MTQSISSWRFPVAAVPTPTRADLSAHSTSTSLSLSNLGSMGLDTSSASSPSPTEQYSTLQYLAFDAFSSPIPGPSTASRPHMRQRSLSASDLPLSTDRPITLAQDPSDFVSPLASRSHIFESTWSLGIFSPPVPSALTDAWESPVDVDDEGWRTIVSPDLVRLGSALLLPSEQPINATPHSSQVDVFETALQRNEAGDGAGAAARKLNNKYSGLTSEEADGGAVYAMVEVPFQPETNVTMGP